MSIRSRLTLFYGSILALSLMGFGVLLYITMEHSTRSFMESTLAAEMRRLVQTDPFALGYFQWPADNVGNRQNYWQACDAKGNVVGRTDNLDGHALPLSNGGLGQLQSGQPVYEIAWVQDTPLLVYSQPLIADGQTIGILQVARSIVDQQQALNTLRTGLILGGLVTLVIAVAGVWFVAGASLRPIDHLTRTAQVIGTERDFQRRVTYDGPQDEVGRLATTFNSMLGALDAAYQKVAQALDAQRSFLADASHELRTPLTTLRGNLALLQRDPPISESDRQAVLSDSVSESERMIRLVKDLMTLARAEHSSTLDLDDVALPSLIGEVQRQFAALPLKQNFTVSAVPDVNALGRRDMLKQVLLILLDNAFKFTPTGGQVELKVDVETAQIALHVRDTGMGIPEDKLPLIFQRFYRADPARHGEGYGLGLTIARALIEKQGGTIAVQSRVGEGSVFTITVRRAPVSATPNGYLPARAHLPTLETHPVAK
jgi:signal transduction histidine kinase